MQAPGRPFTPTAETEQGIPRIVLVRNGATVSSEDGIMMGSGNDPLTTLGEIQAQKTGEVLMDLKVISMKIRIISKTPSAEDRRSPNGPEPQDDLQIKYRIS